MPDYSDWQTYLKDHPNLGQRPFAPVRDPQAMAEMTERARTVVNHPGWQLFLDRVTQRRDLLRRQRATLEREWLDGDALGETLELLKVKIREVKGELAGLDFAMSIVPEMITAGEHLARSVAVSGADAR